MFDYKKCKSIALGKAKDYNTTVDTAYKIGDDYVFENSKEEVLGVLPVVISSSNGACYSLWHYLNLKDKTMDDMEPIDF